MLLEGTMGLIIIIIIIIIIPYPFLLVKLQCKNNKPITPSYLLNVVHSLLL